MNEGPSWLGIGAQRCGTTWFMDLLTQHPQVDIVDGVKEHHWLYRYGLTQEWDEGARKEYRDTFSSPDLKLGEWTPYYLRASWIAHIVADVVPAETPLLVLLRDPIDRFASALRREIRGALRRYEKMMKQEGQDTRGGRKLGVKKKLARITEAAARSRVHGPTKPGEESLVDRTWLRFVGSDVSWGGMYAAQLEMWTSVLPEDRFVVIQYEKLRRDPQHYADLVWKRMGLDPIPLEEPERPSGWSPEVEVWSADDHPEVVRALKGLYRPDAERLASRYDIDLTLWKRTMG